MALRVHCFTENRVTDGIYVPEAETPWQLQERVAGCRSDKWEFISVPL